MNPLHNAYAILEHLETHVNDPDRKGPPNETLIRSLVPTVMDLIASLEAFANHETHETVTKEVRGEVLILKWRVKQVRDACKWYSTHADPL